MFDELKKSSSSIFEERISSPFFGSFIFSWLIWNWQIMYLTFFVSQENIKPLTKIEYIKIHNSNLWYLLAGPLVSAIILITLVPFLSNWLYKIYLKFEKERSTWKEQSDATKRLTIEQSAQIRNEITEQSAKNQQQIDIKVTELKIKQEQVDILTQEKFKFKILFARYGKNEIFIDATAKVGLLITGRNRFIVTNEDLGGDPLPGIPKELFIVYSVQNVIYSTTAKELYEVAMNPTGSTLDVTETPESQRSYQEHAKSISNSISIEHLFPGTWKLAYSGAMNGNEEVNIEGNQYFAKPENSPAFLHYFDLENAAFSYEQMTITFTKVSIGTDNRKVDCILHINEIGKSYQGIESNGTIQVSYMRIS